MKGFKYIAVAFVLMSAVSCGVITRSSYKPTTSQLNIMMSDLEYLGETEISITYDTYLGIFSRIRKINGADFDPAVIQHASLPASQGAVILASLGRKLNRASYLVFEKFPEADYFIVTRQVSRKTVLILGKEVESKATVKAYRFKQE